MSREPVGTYLEFAVASNFSFLRGASHPEELMLQAAHIGLAGIGLCDRNSVAGVVRAHLIKRDYERAATVAKRLSRQKTLDSTAELRLQSLLRELDKFDDPEESAADSETEDYDYSGPRRRWSDDASGGD